MDQERDASSVPHRVARVEPWLALAIAAHGTVLLGRQQTRWWQWALIGIIGLLGAAGVAGWRHDGAATTRAFGILIAIWPLLLSTGGVASYFTLTYFLIVALYPSILPTRWAFTLPLMVIALYAASRLLTDDSLPTFVFTDRILVLLTIGLIAAGLARSNARMTESSARRGAEAEDARARLQTVLDTALDGYLLADHQGRILDVNQAYCRLSGYTRNELLDMNIRELEGSPDDEDVDDRTEQIFTAGRIRFETQHIRKNGSPLDLDVSISTAGTTSGGFVTALVRDISDWKASEAALRESEIRFRTIFEQAPVGMTIVAPDGRFIQANQATADMFGIRNEQFEQMTVGDLNHPDEPHPDELLELFDRSDHVRMQRRYLTPERRELWGLLDATLIRDEHGEPLYMINQLADITERVLAERRLEEAVAQLEDRAAELERSNQDLEQFARVVSHDLAEPLRVVATSVQMLERRHGDDLDPESIELMHFAKDAADRMQQLIADLLDYSKAGEAGNEWEEVDLGRVVEDALISLRSPITQRSSEIATEPLPVVRARAPQLRRVFQNLISNAVKFTPADRTPRLTISAERRENTWRVSVADNGIGMEARHLERIFLPFRRLHPEGEYPGTGIGLAICKRVMDSLGGSIEVESEVGRGSVFTLIFPSEEEAGRE
jgi:PAS domain S-box-containing protein